ncbi:CoA transferase subunit A [bacterium]|nr:MAG: CoA transferase subunit A [bacterium]
MAAVRELIRQGRTGLEVVALVGGIPIDLMAAAGSMDRFTGALFDGTVRPLSGVQERRGNQERSSFRNSQKLLSTRDLEQEREPSFSPDARSDWNRSHCDQPRLVMISDPFGGLDVVACRALIPDVALIHCHRADRFGNLQMDPTAVWPDIGIMPKAASKVIATVEEIVDTEVLRKARKEPFSRVHGRCCRRGAIWGTPHLVQPRYGYDTAFHHEWIAVARDPEGAKLWVERYSMNQTPRKGKSRPGRWRAD